MIFAGPYYIVDGKTSRYPIVKSALQRPASFDPSPLDYGVVAPARARIVPPVATEATDFVWLESPTLLSRVVIRDAHGQRTNHSTRDLRALVEPSSPVGASTWLLGPELVRVYPHTVRAQLPGRLPGVREAVYTALTVAYGRYDLAAGLTDGVHPIGADGALWVTLLRHIGSRPIGVTFEVDVPEEISAPSLADAHVRCTEIVDSTLAWVESHQVTSAPRGA